MTEVANDMDGGLGSWRTLSELVLELGESPRWDVARGWVWVVDLLRGDLHAIDLDGTVCHSTSFGRALGSIALSDDGSIGLFLRDGLHRYWPESGDLARVAAPPYAPETHLFNDCAVDPSGRLLVGVAAEDESPGAGSLWAWSPHDGFTVLREGMTLPNGMGWLPPTGERALVDSLARTIDVEGGPAWRVPEEWGLADGMAVDGEGGVWVAFWDGGCVRRLDGAGRVVDRLAVPAPQVTAPLLVPRDNGATLLVVTTARVGEDPDTLAGPAAGRLLVRAVDVPAGVTPAFHW